MLILESIKSMKTLILRYKNTNFIIIIFLITINIIQYFNNSYKSEIIFSNEILNGKENKNLVDLSIKLHKVLQVKGQLECEKSSNEVSKSGGWCSKISGRNSSQHLFDTQLAKALSSFLEQKTVASFGDGPGVYKEELTKLNQVVLYDAFDGAPYVQSSTNNQVQYIDLSVPIYHLNKYDWIVSLEVAEHIPAQFEAVFIDNLVRHSKEGIILSWAKVGQDGHSHVNNKNADYVIKLMKQKNFSHDLDSSNYLKMKSTFSWFKDNINVFKRIQKSENLYS